MGRHSLKCNEVKTGEQVLGVLEDDDMLSLGSVLRARISRHQEAIKIMGKYKLYLIHRGFIFVKGDF